MNYLDVIIAIPLLWGLYRGFMKGFIIQLATLLALMLGTWLATLFSRDMEEVLKTKLDMHSQYLPEISFAMIFVGVILFVLAVAKITELIAKITLMSPLNKIAGAAFGFLKYLVTILVVLFIFDTTHMISDKTKNGSYIYSRLNTVVPAVFPKLKGMVNP